MCLNSSSASVTCPFFISFNAAAYCCAACGGTGAGTGAEFAGVPAAAEALGAGVLSTCALADAGGTGGAAGAGRAAGALAAGAGAAALAAGAGAAVLAAGAGAEPLLLGAALGAPPGAALGTAASAFTVPSAPRFTIYRAGACESSRGVLWQAARRISPLRLTNRFDQWLTDLHLAVTAWIELCQGRETLLHPFIVGALLGSRGVDFMQFDRLFLERKCLLLEQHVVLFQLVLGKILRALRTQQVLAQLTVQLCALERRCCGDLGYLVVGRLSVSFERRLHRLALFRQRFLQRRNEFDAYEVFTGRRCQR